MSRVDDANCDVICAPCWSSRSGDDDNNNNDDDEDGACATRNQPIAPMLVCAPTTPAALIRLVLRHALPAAAVDAAPPEQPRRQRPVHNVASADAIRGDARTTAAMMSLLLEDERELEIGSIPIKLELERDTHSEYVYVWVGE